MSFELALRLGKTRRELLEGMTVRDLAEWIVFLSEKNK